PHARHSSASSAKRATQDAAPAPEEQLQPYHCETSSISLSYELIRNARCFTQVGIAGQLSQHEVRHVRPRYFGLNGLVRGVKPTTVHALARAIGKHRRSHDYPVQLALLNELLLDLFVGKNVSQQDRNQQVVVQEAELSSAVANTKGRCANETLHAHVLHRSDHILGAFRQRGCPSVENKDRKDGDAESNEPSDRPDQGGEPSDYLTNDHNSNQGPNPDPDAESGK